MIRPVIHLFLHGAVPGAVAATAYRERWKKAWLWMMTGMAIDLDHLLANPIFDSNRCSIGFHPLHTWPAIVVYVGLLFPKKTRLVGLGLVIHIILDLIDCAWMRLG